MATRCLSLVMVFALLGATTTSMAQSTPDQVIVLAAGSLRGAITELARSFERQAQVGTKLSFGPSGLLKERIEGGEIAQVFASANMSHPQALQASGRAQAIRPFARNALCALASGEFSLRGKTLAQRLLDADVRIGISTPRADPAGDYAHQMFERIEASGAADAGSAGALKAKALALTGGPDSPQPPPGRSLYGLVMSEGRADVFITYCTNAVEARQQVPSLQVLAVPDPINVSALYGLATLLPVSSGGQAFVDFVLGPRGQAILAAHGFSPP